MKQRLAWQFDTQSASQEIPYLKGTLRFINVFTRAQNGPHLNQMNSIHIPMPQILHYVPSTTVSQKWYFLLIFYA
jgi:hypothetical protein